MKELRNEGRSGGISDGGKKLKHILEEWSASTLSEAGEMNVPNIPTLSAVLASCPAEQKSQSPMTCQSVPRHGSRCWDLVSSGLTLSHCRCRWWGTEDRGVRMRVMRESCSVRRCAGSTCSSHSPEATCRCRTQRGTDPSRSELSLAFRAPPTDKMCRWRRWTLLKRERCARSRERATSLLGWVSASLTSRTRACGTSSEKKAVVGIVAQGVRRPVLLARRSMRRMHCRPCGWRSTGHCRRTFSAIESRGSCHG